MLSHTMQERGPYSPVRGSHGAGKGHLLPPGALLVHDPLGVMHNRHASVSLLLTSAAHWRCAPLQMRASKLLEGARTRQEVLPWAQTDG